MSQDAIFSPDTDEARLAGYQAARRGECYRTCPHPYRTPLRTAWLEGWRAWVNQHPIIDRKAPAADFRTGAAA